MTTLVWLSEPERDRARRRDRRSLRCKIPYLHGLYQPLRGFVTKNMAQTYGNTDPMTTSSVTTMTMRNIWNTSTKTQSNGFTMNYTPRNKSRNFKNGYRGTSVIWLALRIIKSGLPCTSSLYNILFNIILIFFIDCDNIYNVGLYLIYPSYFILK